MSGGRFEAHGPEPVDRRLVGLSVNVLCEGSREAIGSLSDGLKIARAWFGESAWIAMRMDGRVRIGDGLGQWGEGQDPFGALWMLLTVRACEEVPATPAEQPIRFVVEMSQDDPTPDDAARLSRELEHAFRKVLAQ